MQIKGDFKLKPKTFFKYNLIIITCLILIHTAVSLLYFYFEPISFLPFPIRLIDFYRYFDIGSEKNIPTAYQALMIFISSSSLFLLSYFENTRRGKFYFKFLSFLFFYIGWDELFTLHEQFDKPFREILNTSGFFYHAWVIPYGILVLIIALSLFNFIKTFPSRIRNIILLAGFIYVLGELGFELLSANIISLSKYQTLTQNQIIARYFFELIEESFGLLGILLFNYALLSLLKIKNATVQIKFL